MHVQLRTGASSNVSIVKPKFPTMYTQTPTLVSFFIAFILNRSDNSFIAESSSKLIVAAVGPQVDACASLLCKRQVEQLVELSYPHSSAS
jgi:hypothetical protein